MNAFWDLLSSLHDNLSPLSCLLAEQHLLFINRLFTKLFFYSFSTDCAAFLLCLCFKRLLRDSLLEWVTQIIHQTIILAIHLSNQVIHSPATLPSSHRFETYCFALCIFLITISFSIIVVPRLSTCTNGAISRRWLSSRPAHLSRLPI